MKDKKKIFLIIGITVMALMGISAIFSWKKSGNEAPEAEVLPVISESCKNSIVQIQTEQFWGSGFIYRVTDSEIWVLTNRHVVETAETCDVVFAKGFYYEGSVERLYEDHDLALITVERADMDSEDLETVKPIEALASQDELEMGDRLYLYGSAAYPGSHYYGAQLLDVEIEVPEMGDSFLVGMLNEDQEWSLIENGSEKTAKLEDGLSGSPVFEEHGRLVGILAGGNEKTFVAVQVWHITAEDGLSED